MSLDPRFNQRYKTTPCLQKAIYVRGSIAAGK